MKPGNLEIEVTTRPEGKTVGKLRRESAVPGIVYGTVLKKSMSLTAPQRVISKYGTHQFENTIFTLRSEDKGLNDVKVLIKEIARHPVTKRPLHIDFLAIDLKKAVRVPVELRYEGRAIGVAEGGVLQPILRELEIECLPTAIPEFLLVDVSNMGLMDSLHISDLQLPEGVKAVTHENLTLVTVAVIREEAAAPAAAPAAAAEPEVIAKGKKPEEGAAAAPAKDAKAAPAKDAKK